MDIDDIPEEIQRVTQTAQLTKPLWQGLPNLIKGWALESKLTSSTIESLFETCFVKTPETHWPP